MTKKKEEIYYEGVGRRKASVARVRVFKDEGKTTITVNDKKLEEYFTTQNMIASVMVVLEATANKEGLRVTVKVEGGGLSGQAEAVQLGLARALVKYKDDYQRALRDLGYLKRDPRSKERKKPGLKKARKSPQWSKR